MCGILGTLPATNEQQFKQALDTLTHRGPDDYGIESIGSEIRLGHRRLSIVDLSNHGHQPMFDCSKRYSLVFNGEIYNFIEIKKELQKKGYQFRSSSDTEVLLYAFIEWGKNCVLKFNGMWAFAIWDSIKKELFLSRDRFGKKPLFYSQVDGQFIFASEMKAIYPFLKEVKPSKDFHWIKNHIMIYESTNKCLIEGIKRFPAGYNGILKDGKLELKRYWNTLDHLEEVPSSYEEQVERYRELFLDACKIRMRSDVPIGTALSGGLDSSATISVMHYLNSQNLNNINTNNQHAFISSMPNTILDETKYAKIVLDHIGINGIYNEVNPKKGFQDIYKHIYQFEELYVTSPVPMLQTYASVRENSVTVTLDGHGADELMSGYGGDILYALFDAKFNLKEINNIFDIYYGKLQKNDQFDFKDQRVLQYLKFMIKESIKILLNRSLNSNDKGHQDFKKLDWLNKKLYILTHETVLPTLLRNYDRYSMANSVEIRMPFMDHRLITYSMSLPSSSKLKNGYTKSIIRDAVAKYLPQDIAYRKEKVGWNSPIVDWMKGDLREFFGDIVNSKSFNQSSLVQNQIDIKQRFENLNSSNEPKMSDGVKIWNDIYPYLWEESVIKGKGFD
jgi:asparagine synthase (glutamine-hydrolysing)